MIVKVIGHFKTLVQLTSQARNSTPRLKKGRHPHFTRKEHYFEVHIKVEMETRPRTVLVSVSDGRLASERQDLSTVELYTLPGMLITPERVCN